MTPAEEKSAARLSLERAALIASAELLAVRGCGGYTDDHFDDQLIRASDSGTLRAIIAQAQRAADALS